LQLLPAQQTWPTPPQVMHWPAPASTVAHTSAASHWLPQQASPALPQAVHIPLLQRVPPAVQDCWLKPPPGPPPSAPASLGSGPQQTWFSAPHGAPLAVVHDPALQVPDTPVPVQA
jgi:hypothetical protein